MMTGANLRRIAAALCLSAVSVQAQNPDRLTPTREDDPPLYRLVIGWIADSEIDRRHREARERLLRQKALSLPNASVPRQLPPPEKGTDDDVRSAR